MEKYFQNQLSCKSGSNALYSDGNRFSWGRKVISTFSGACHWFYCCPNPEYQCFSANIRIKIPSRVFSRNTQLALQPWIIRHLNEFHHWGALPDAPWETAERWWKHSRPHGVRHTHGGAQERREAQQRDEDGGHLRGAPRLPRRLTVHHQTDLWQTTQSQRSQNHSSESLRKWFLWVIAQKVFLHCALWVICCSEINMELWWVHYIHKMNINYIFKYIM